MRRALVDAALDRRAAGAARLPRRRSTRRCATASLAGGKRLRPLLTLAAAEAVDPRRRQPRRPSPRAAGRLRHRADSYLLADPRRPAGDGRRLAAARPADARTSSSATAWPSSPATACSPKRSRCSRASRRRTIPSIARRKLATIGDRRRPPPVPPAWSGARPSTCTRRGRTATQRTPSLDAAALATCTRARPAR